VHSCSQIIRECLGYGANKMTSHGFRMAASSLSNESKNGSPDAIERALAHKDKNEVRGIYNRSPYWLSAWRWRNGRQTISTNSGTVVKCKTSGDQPCRKLASLNQLVNRRSAQAWNINRFTYSVHESCGVPSCNAFLIFFQLDAEETAGQA
jgi:hypothetical protein